MTFFARVGCPKEERVRHEMHERLDERSIPADNARRGARRAGVCLDGVLQAALRCTAVLADAVGSSHEQHRRSRRRHG